MLQRRREQRGGKQNAPQNQGNALDQEPHQSDGNTQPNEVTVGTAATSASWAEMTPAPQEEVGPPNRNSTAWPNLPSKAHRPMTSEAQKQMDDANSRIASLEKTVSELVKGQQSLQEQQEATKKGQKRRMTAIEKNLSTKLDIQSRNLKEFLTILTNHIAPNNAGALMAAWNDPENPESETLSDADGDEEGDSSSESNDDDDDTSALKTSDSPSRSRLAASKSAKDDNQRQASYVQSVNNKPRTGVASEGQEAHDLGARTSGTVTGSSKDTESSSPAPTMPMMPQLDPQELMKLQATTGQAVGLKNVDLTNAHVAYMGGLLVIKTNTIPGIPESWTQMSSNQSPRDSLVEAAHIPRTSVRSPEDTTNNG